MVLLRWQHIGVILISLLRRRFSAVFIFFALSCGAASAHGEIVYGARYYFPPGSSGTSHSHIYRIDVDGTHRVQLTNGNCDDVDPTWVDGGKSIEFTRTVQPSGDQVAMIMRANGSNQRRDRTLVNNDDSFDDGQDEFLSPDKRHMCVLDDSTPNGSTKIIDAKTGNTIGVAEDYGGVMWPSNGDFAEISWQSEHGYPLTIYDLHGKQLRAVLLTVVKQYDGWQVIRGGGEQVWPDPLMPGTFFDSQHAQMADVLFWIDPHRLLIRYITASDGETLSPDRKCFCTCSFNGTTNYQHRPDGTWRTVWASSLVIVGTKTLEVKVLQGGLVDCCGSDWRGGRRVGDE